MSQRLDFQDDEDGSQTLRPIFADTGADDESLSDPIRHDRTNLDLSEIRRQGLYRVRRKLQSAQGPRIRWRNRQFLNFSSNDYLNLAADSRLAKAAARAVLRFGTGAGASPLISGYLPPIRQLERALAAWEETEGALVFSTGFAANLGLVSSLAGSDDVIFSDALNHASLIDGCRLSRARVHVFRHTDANHLEDLLRREGSQARRRLIVTDSIFSMDGDWAPLADLLDLAQRRDVLLVVDEAHATGVLGTRGRGLSELLIGTNGHNAGRLVKVGTLSKALGSQGGFVCGTRNLINGLVNQCRPYIYSTALAPACAAAARRAVAIVQEEPGRRGHLLALADFLRNRLHEAGFAHTHSRCHIVPVMVGEASAALELSARLAECDMLVPAIRPPSVPEHTSRLRISLTAGHTEDDVDRLVRALEKSLKEGDIAFSRHR
jgi:8-amino-7-oxononanoate synthase